MVYRHRLITNIVVVNLSFFLFYISFLIWHWKIASDYSIFFWMKDFWFIKTMDHITIWKNRIPRHDEWTDGDSDQITVGTKFSCNFRENIDFFSCIRAELNRQIVITYSLYDKIVWSISQAKRWRFLKLLNIDLLINKEFIMHVILVMVSRAFIHLYIYISR